MFPTRPLIRLLTLLFVASSSIVLTTASAEAGTVSKEVPFELDRWIELESTDGPVTLHRIRLHLDSGGFTKSKFFRPGNDEFLETVQIQLEYSNAASRDWEVEIDLRWVDAEGNSIDGYNDEEDLDDEKRHGEATVTLSTLRYGLDRAERMLIDLDYGPN